jgi:hypothetical protein
MPRLSLWRETHTNDFKFQDKRISELFTASGVGIYVHKYLGTYDQGPSNDLTEPRYANDSERNIQDLLFLENRNRKYEADVYELRGHYTPQDQDFNLMQFGLFIAQDTLFITFHTSDMVARIGRKLMAGDVLELPNMGDYNPLDETIPVVLKKFYVIQETARAAEGYAPTWWPHLMRAKVVPMVDGQEYQDILNRPAGTGTDKTLQDLLSQFNQNVQINDTIIAQANVDVPLSGYDVTGLYVLPTDPNNRPLETVGITADNLLVSADSDIYTADVIPITPTTMTPAYLNGNGTAPNGWPVTAATAFPPIPEIGQYVLRVDFLPNRLFRYDGTKWVAVVDSTRAPLTPNVAPTLRGSFVNNPNVTTTSSGQTIAQKQGLSSILRTLGQ